MKIAIAADHAGFSLKERLKQRLSREGYDVVDYGTNSEAPCDYPDFAAAVAREVAQGRSERGVLVCLTGMGMAIAANKFPGVRAALGTSVDEVRLTRAHNDANILTLGAKYTDEAGADAMLDVFLATPFEGGRHARRLAKIAELDNEALGGER